MSNIGSIAAEDLNLEQGQAQDDNQSKRDENIEGEDTDGGPKEKTGMIASLKSGAGKVGEAYDNMGAKMKVALFAGIAAALFASMDKITPILAKGLKFFKETLIPAFKRMFDVFMEDIGPVFDRVVEAVSSFVGGIKDFVVGIFTLDFDMIKSGIKKVFLEAIPNAISAIGTAIYSVLDMILAFFGFDEDSLPRRIVRTMKEAFKNLPETLKKMVKFITDGFDSAVNFVTVTIPQFFTDMKDNIVQNVQDNVQGIKDFFSDAFNFITETIPAKFQEFKDYLKDSVSLAVDNIKEGIVGVINRIKDTFTMFLNKLKGIANAVIETVNKVPGFNFKTFEMEPLSTDIVEAHKEATGDASIAEAIGMERNEKIKKKANFMQKTDEFIYDDTMPKFKSRNLNTYDKRNEYRDRREQVADLGFEMNKADKAAYDKQYDQRGQPIVINKSETAGSTTNNSQIFAAEPATDHPDMTAKHLADSLSNAAG